MADTVSVKMEKMVFGGDCLARLPDGRAVFVPFVLPGEQVLIALTEEKQRYARGMPVTWIETSPDRISPRCKHFGQCGGCQYQHLDYAKQLALKEDILKDQFKRIAGIDDPRLQPIVPALSPWNYRNYIQFHLGKQGEPGFVHVDGEHILIVEECHLPQAQINQLWPQVELGPDSGIYRMAIRKDTYDSLMLIMEGEDPVAPEFSEDIPVSAVYTPPDARLTVLAGEDALTFEALGRTFQVSARSFFQVNTPIAEQMITHLLGHLDLSPATSVLELFAGVGFFSAFIAPKVSHLTAVESSGSACHDFAVNLDDFDNVDLYESDAEEALPALNGAYDLLIMDPPRSGLMPAVHNALARMKPTQIAYISCDPATLARDVKRILGNGYRLESTTPFDMFPHTAHVETVVLMSRKIKKLI